jgi:hypothetical protein
MAGIQGISRAQAHVAHTPSRHAKEMAAAAKGTFPTTIDDLKLSAKVEKMHPNVIAHETAKGGRVTLVYHFKSPAEAKAVYDSATELYQGKRFPSSSLGDNIAECLDSTDEVGDPTLNLKGNALLLSVGFKPAK